MTETWDYRVNCCLRCLAQSRQRFEDVQPATAQGQCFTCGYGFNADELRRVQWYEVKGLISDSESHWIARCCSVGARCRLRDVSRSGFRG